MPLSLRIEYTDKNLVLPDFLQMAMDLIKNNLANHNRLKDDLTTEMYDSYEIHDPQNGFIRFYHKIGMGGMPTMEVRLTQAHLKALEYGAEHAAELFHQKVAVRE